MPGAVSMHGSYDEQLREWLGQKIKMGEKNTSCMCFLLYAWEEGLVQSCGQRVPNRVCIF